MCSKKDYEAVAKIIAFYANTKPAQHDREGAKRQVVRASTACSIADDIADHFESDNPRFDRARFLTACGVQS